MSYAHIGELKGVRLYGAYQPNWYEREARRQRAAEAETLRLRKAVEQAERRKERLAWSLSTLVRR